MLKNIFRTIMSLLFILGWGLAALSLHVIRTPDEIPITLVPKERLGFTDTYVDTRHWTLDDVALHKPLVEKLVRSGKADVLKHLISERGSDPAAQLTEALHRQPKATEPSGSPSTGQTGAEPPSTSAEKPPRKFLGLF
jgi:hypothetical protein